MNRDVLKPRALPPVDFAAWMHTRSELGAAVTSRPGLICLTGPEGSGKTYTLRLYKLSVRNLRVGYRMPGEQAEEALQIDLVDQVDATNARVLARDIPPGTVRVLAIRPDVLPAVLQIRPDTKVIQVHRMEDADVRTMVSLRSGHFGLAPDEFTGDAVQELLRLSNGTPRRIDRLFGLAVKHAIEAGLPAVDASHIVMAGMTDRALAVTGPTADAHQIFSNITAETVRHPAAPAAPEEPEPQREPVPPPASPVQHAPEPQRAQPIDPAGARLSGNGPLVPSQRWAFSDLPAQPVDALERAARSRTRGRWGASAGLAAAVLLAIVMLPRPQTQSISSILPTTAERIPSADPALLTTAAAPPQVKQASATPAPAFAGETAVAALTRHFNEYDPVQLFVLHQPRPASSPDPAGPPSAQPPAAVTEADTVQPKQAPPATPQPAVVPARAPSPASAPDPAEADRLLQLARAMESIGQLDDARQMFRASAALGNAEAQQQVAVKSPAAAKRVQSR